MKKIIIPIIILTLLVSVVAAFVPIFFQWQSPADLTYWILGEDNFTFYVNASPLSPNNITNATFYTNISGAWTAEVVESTKRNHSAGGQVNFTFSPGTDLNLSVSNGLQFVWNALICSNSSAGGNCSYAENRTIYAENEPVYDILNITQGNKSNNGGTKINTTNVVRNNITTNITGDGESYKCDIYTNRSGANHSDGVWSYDFYFIAQNSSTFDYTYTFDDDNTTKWNVYCCEDLSSDICGWGENRTLKVGTTPLAVTLNYPTTPYITENNTVQINFTGVSSLLGTCNVHLDQSTTANESTTAMTDGTQYNIYNWTIITDGRHNITIDCNDTKGNTVNTSMFYFTVDTVWSTLGNLTNNTVDLCDAFGVKFNTTEALSSSTVTAYVTGSNELVSTSTDSHNGSLTDLLRYHNISFGDYAEENLTLNFTLTDLAGNSNVNGSITQRAPLGVCSGWSVFSMYDTKTNISNIESQMRVTDYIYLWNATSQGWVYKTNGTATNGNTDLRVGDVIYTYNTANGTWFRNITIATYTQNLTNGSNYLAAPFSVTFGNVTSNWMKNSSKGNWVDGALLNITPFASWNNSGKEWVSAAFNFTWENDTLIGRGSNTSLDAVWTYLDDRDVIFNASDGAGHHISGNWS